MYPLSTPTAEVLAAGINADSIVTWSLATIIPLILLFVGISIMAGARRGDVSGGMNTTMVVLLGAIVIVGVPLFIAIARQVVGVFGA